MKPVSHKQYLVLKAYFPDLRKQLVISCISSCMFNMHISFIIFKICLPLYMNLSLTRKNHKVNTGFLFVCVLLEIFHVNLGP